MDDDNWDEAITSAPVVPTKQVDENNNTPAETKSSFRSFGNNSESNNDNSSSGFKPRREGPLGRGRGFNNNRTERKPGYVDEENTEKKVKVTKMPKTKEKADSVFPIEIKIMKRVEKNPKADLAVVVLLIVEEMMIMARNAREGLIEAVSEIEIETMAKEVKNVRMDSVEADTVIETETMVKEVKKRRRFRSRWICK